jgi:N6-adenosine-specific RNA methylase IME4
MGGGKRKLKYDTMDLDEIKAMGDRIQEVTSDTAHLWLWTTNSHLPESLGVVDAWGFEYKGLRTWNKVKMGLGWWLRNQTEHLILAVKKGKVRLRLDHPDKWTTLFTSPRRKHSEKPIWGVYDCITALSRAPYLELFANVEKFPFRVHKALVDVGWAFQEADHQEPEDEYKG